MYDIARKLLFCFSPEISHELSLDGLGAAHRLGLLNVYGEMPQNPVEVMGIRFPNPVGLAAGLDKNGDYFNALGALGFGFVEIGTVTPLPQPGNPEPRLFRLVEQEAIINRMGFNNKGVDYLVEQTIRRRYKGVLGINIGKNKITPEDEALDDYLTCLRAVYDYADYVTINISSPNTPGLRNLQYGDSLKRLIGGIIHEREALALHFEKHVPIVVKIAPDMNESELKAVADTLVEAKVDGIIASNTTISREGVESSEFADEAGGLSGSPVRDKSTEVIRTLSQHLDGTLPIIGVGGISTARHALDKIEAGAQLIQIYSGFIYKGPSLIRQITQALP